MACHCHIMVKKRQTVHFLLFLSGVGILVWQIWNTFQAFIEEQTAFAISQQYFDVLEPPAVILCPKDNWNGFFKQARNISDDWQLVSNISDNDWHAKQFFLLNDTLTLSLRREFHNDHEYGYFSNNLTLGENFDEKGKTFVVKELMNPFFGMCYALIPDVNLKINLTNQFIFLAKVAKREDIPSFDIFTLHPEDRYGFLLPDLAPLGKRSVIKSSYLIDFKVRKVIWNYLSSKKNCRQYEKADSFAKCIMKKQVDCYQRIGLKRGCNCVAENIFKTHFEFHPITSWNVCTTNSEYRTCLWTMNNCYYSKMVRDACPLPCQKVVYKATKLDTIGFRTNPNEILFGIRFETMDVEKHDEVWILETYTFVGTVGGSLGLFIGFSYTGFFGQILDCLFFRYVEN